MSMPTELLQEFIGKRCTIAMLDEAFEFEATILAVRENWLKVEDKKTVRLLNADMIRSVKLKKE